MAVFQKSQKQNKKNGTMVRMIIPHVYQRKRSMHRAVEIWNDYEVV